MEQKTITINGKKNLFRTLYIVTFTLTYFMKTGAFQLYKINIKNGNEAFTGTGSKEK